MAASRAASGPYGRPELPFPPDALCGHPERQQLPQQPHYAAKSKPVGELGDGSGPLGIVSFLGTHIRTKLRSRCRTGRCANNPFRTSRVNSPFVESGDQRSLPGYAVGSAATRNKTSMCIPTPTPTPTGYARVWSFPTPGPPWRRADRGHWLGQDPAPDQVVDPGKTPTARPACGRPVCWP